MKTRRHSYFFVGTTRPTEELNKDDWGVKRLYLSDDIFNAREMRNHFNIKRAKGSKIFRIFRVRFTEVW